jgi:hypothetical protein
VSLNNVKIPSDGQDAGLLNQRSSDIGLLKTPLKYFRYWLVNHIDVHDKRIGAFVEQGWETPGLKTYQCEREPLCQRQARRFLC